jgi:single-strand DNA-binding protein
MNEVILTGNLTNDVEARQTTNGKSVVSACIAVKRDYKESDGTYSTDFINFVAWGLQAEYLAKYAKKGDRLEIVGRWQVRSYEKDGQKVRVDEVVAESVAVFTKQPKMLEVQADDLPF